MFWFDRFQSATVSAIKTIDTWQIYKLLNHNQTFEIKGKQFFKICLILNL